MNSIIKMEDYELSKLLKDCTVSKICDKKMDRSK